MVVNSWYYWFFTVLFTNRALKRSTKLFPLLVVVAQLSPIVTVFSSNQSAAAPFRCPPTTAFFLASIVQWFITAALSNVLNHSTGSSVSALEKGSIFTVALSPVA